MLSSSFSSNATDFPARIAWRFLDFSFGVREASASTSKTEESSSLSEPPLRGWAGAEMRLEQSGHSQALVAARVGGREEDEEERQGTCHWVVQEMHLSFSSSGGKTLHTIQTPWLSQGY